jgi:aldose 1-epimerase
MKALVALAAAALAACSSMHHSSSSRDFGVDRHGRPATLWTLRAPGAEIDVTDHGATLVAVRMPDRGGRWQDVILGFDGVGGYESEANQYFGCTTGRVCNRIAKAAFTLDGYTYRLAANNGPNHLHGGATRSLDKVHWRSTPVSGPHGMGVRFAYRSPDGEEGYWLSAQNEIRIDYEARSDRRTPVNLTNHAYWNLAGAGAPSVLDHDLRVDADHYTPTDDTLIPTGAIAPVAGTDLDFRTPLPIGLRIDRLTATPARGYDHNFVLRAATGLREVAKLSHAASGRSVTVATTEPGLQVYCGNFLNGQTGKAGATYAHRSAVCLETQHFPDSVNQPKFPNTILAPGTAFTSTTVLTLRSDGS